MTGEGIFRLACLAVVWIAACFFTWRKTAGWDKTDRLWMRWGTLLVYTWLCGLRAYLVVQACRNPESVAFSVLLHDGRGVLVEPHGLGEDEARIWSAAGRAAQEVVGPLDGTPPLVRVEWRRGKRGRGEPLGEARGGTVAVWASGDPVRDAFRAGHECGHAAAAARHGEGRLPLWAEEGLAQLSGFRAAAKVARSAGRDAVEKPPPAAPGGWPHLADLLACRDYPADRDAIAVFYWQSAMLLRALSARLGPAHFPEFLDALAGGADPAALLRERYWFSDADLESLDRFIQPDPPPLPASAAWTL